MKNIAFTICAKNYIGLSLVLKESYLANNPKDCFYIFVADEDDTSMELPEDTFIAKDLLGYSENKWTNMAFKYNLTEFCTAIKPDCFKWIFENITDAGKVCYLDPDILIFNSFSHLWGLLDNYKIIVTPHLTTMESVFSGDIPEDEILYAGQFNLGFLAVKKTDTVIKTMEWWAVRLENYCYGDISTHLCYDQKWIDFLISYINHDDLYILREPGYNVAPWNFYEREIIKGESVFKVRNRIIKNEESCLYFIHYSGYNYKALMEHKVRQGNIAEMKSYSDVQEVLKYYGDILKEHESLINKYINNKYTYGYFDNGKPIDPFHRQLYRGLGNDQALYGNPFSCESAFYNSLRKHNLLVESIGTNVDKICKRDINPAIQKKLYIINNIFIMLYKILGIQKYKMLLRFLKYYGQSKYHIHLLSKKYRYTNIKM